MKNDAMCEREPEPERGGASTAAPSVANNDRLMLLSELMNSYAYSLVLSPSEDVRFEWVTASFERSFRIRAGQVMSADSWRSRIPPEDRAAVSEWQQLLLDGSAGALEHRVIGIDGSVLWMQHSARAIEFADGVRVIGQMIDITEGKLAVQALERSEERFRTLTDEIRDLVIEVNEHGRVVFVNRALRDILGWEPEALMGARFPDGDTQNWVESGDETARLRENLFAEDQTTTGRTRFRHTDGSWRWIELTATTYATAERLHRVIVGHDVTQDIERVDAERRRAEQLETEVQQRTEELRSAYARLRELQERSVDEGKLETAKELAGKVAHAINNPLAALIGRVQMERETPRPSREGLLHIRHLAQRIQSVVLSTLTLYREGRLQLECAHPADLLQDLCKELADRAKKRNVELRLSVEPDVPRLMVDRTLLTAALVSLAENGIDAMPDGGSLELQAVHLPQSELVQFRIGDHGKGIPPELVPRIFEPFFTTKPAGTGLGLPIAKGVVRGHRGRIEMQPRASGGTWFAVSIPYVERDPSRAVSALAAE